jgi:hypothetical protein
MLRPVTFALGALLLACGRSQTRVAGQDIALSHKDEAPREGKTVRRVGVMWSLSGDTTTLVDVPAHTRANEATPVRVEVASGGCSGRDTTMVSVDGLVATVVPYQKVFTPVPPDGACAAYLAADSRTVRVTFLARGLGRVRIVYRQGDRGPLTMTERSITVE